MKFFDRFRKDKDQPEGEADATAAAGLQPQSEKASVVVQEKIVAEQTTIIEEKSAAEKKAAAEEKPGFFDRFKLGADKNKLGTDRNPFENAANNVSADSPPSQSDIETLTGESKTNFFTRLKAGLRRTSTSFSEGVGNLFLGKKAIDDELFEELETQLLMADVGIDATQLIIGNLTKRVSRKELSDAEALYGALQEELKALIAPCTAPLAIAATQKPFVILMVGVNGVGKTTTIGKLAKRYQSEGKSVMLAAGDTFRAAAVEQLQVWGERNNVPVIAQHTGADSASVLFDALKAAQARGTDILIADTAGRLHNKDNLMEELKKIVRVMRKLDASAPHEVLLVLDAGTGQNALAQVKHFQEAVGVSGIALTKLDGTAKGGIIFAISRQSGLPIRFIGVGEQIDDLRPFNADEFISALFERESART